MSAPAWIQRWLQAPDDELLDAVQDTEPVPVFPEMPPFYGRPVPSPPPTWDTLDEEPEAL